MAIEQTKTQAVRIPAQLFISSSLQCEVLLPLGGASAWQHRFDD
jgi:hypothetical protein